MKSILLAAALVAVSSVAQSQVAFKSDDPFTAQRVNYACDRGTTIPATYVQGGGDGVVVLQLEGRQILLYQEVSASGVRYGWPSDGANYVWATKAQNATLLWKEAGTEMLLMTCTEAQ